MNLMPPEWSRHERTWVAFPSQGYTLGQTEQEQLAARKTWASVANAATEFEKVSVVVHPRDVSIAKQFLSSACEIVEIEIDDAWIRDSGPTFVSSEGKLAAVDWIFNGWGNQGWASFEKDAKLARAIAAHLGITVLDSSLVNEGGGFMFQGMAKCF